MSKFLSEKKKDIISFFIFVFIFIIFYIINKRTPIWSDDWAFYVGYQNQRIHSISEVFSSISYFYFNVNGRSVANLITMSFVFFGKNVFNFFNALIFVFLGYEIYFFASDGRKIRPAVLVGIFLLLWFFLPVPNETLFWMAGSAYLWMTVLCLFFLMPYKALLLEGNDIFKNKHFPWWVGMFFLGLLAGNTHELVAPVVILSAGFVIFVLFNKKTCIPKWCYIGLMGVFFGFVAQLVAPGNYKKNMQGGDAFDFFGGLNQVFNKIIERQLVLWEIAGVIIVVYLLNRIFLKSGKKIADLPMFFLLGIALILNLMGIVYPYFPPRALFFSSVALIIFVGRFLFFDEFVKIKYLLIMICIPVFILSARESLEKSDALFQKYEKRDNVILEQKSNGNTDIIVNRIKIIKNRLILNDPLLLAPDKNFWASRFYEVDSIIILK